MTKTAALTNMKRACEFHPQHHVGAGCSWIYGARDGVFAVGGSLTRHSFMGYPPRQLYPLALQSKAHLLRQEHTVLGLSLSLLPDPCTLASLI